MRIYRINRKVIVVISGLAAAGMLSVGTLVYAAGGVQPSVELGSVAASAAIRALPVGTGNEAIDRLYSAAEQGSLPAMWRLAHMFKEGNEVNRDLLAAFDLFSQIADQNAEVDPATAEGRLVADAFVNLADIYLVGIEGTRVTRNDALAARLLTHAATYFGEPDAQYQLARLYVEGRGVERSTRRAVSWLILAARKRHTEAQGLLGMLLFKGSHDDQDELPPIRSTGLMWLEIAKRFADPATQGWVVDGYKSAFASASTEEAAAATAMADHWLANNGPTN